MLFGVRCLGDRCSLFVVGCLLFVAYCACLLIVVVCCCLLFVVRGVTVVAGSLLFLFIICSFVVLPAVLLLFVV